MISVDITARRGNFLLEAAWHTDRRHLGVFGPSGSGKTTLLSILAGLIRPTRGRITVEDRVWFDSEAGIDLSPQDRGVGFVFQNARLFPHWSVQANLTASPACAADPSAFDQVVSLFELNALLPRSVADLSGGETKRVAMARALLRQPRLFLLDEPLTGLDAGLRRKIFSYLLSLKDTVATPMLYVSHRYSDFLALTDWVVFLENGRATRQGPPHQTLEFVDEESPIETTLPGLVLEQGETGSRVACGNLKLWAPSTAHAPGSRVHLTIKAEDCVLAPEKPPRTSARNCFPADILAVVPGRGRCWLQLDAGGAVFLAELTPQSVRDLGLVSGKTVYVLLKVRSLRTGD